MPVSRTTVLVFVVLTAGCSDPWSPSMGMPADLPPQYAMGSCEAGVTEDAARAQIGALRDEVDRLEAAGSLGSGQANALRNHLDNALRHLDAGRLCPALAQLGAFREQVGNFVDAGVLTAGEATALLDGVDLVLDGAPPILVQATIQTGVTHTCALTGTGAAWCWGSNTRGQLGDGTLAPSAVPVAVAGGQTFATLTVGNGVTCGITPDSSAYCWGWNREGAVGDGTTMDRSTPTPVSGGHIFRAIDAGDHTCAVRMDGSAWCWGGNTSGELGDGTVTDRHAPTPVSTTDRFVSISAGMGEDAHTCAIREDSVPVCWGANVSGQLGDGTTSSRSVPAPVLSIAHVSAITAGNGHTCALRTVDAAALCWGYNGTGALGDGTAVDRHSPVLVAGGQTFSSLDAGGLSTCGIRAGDSAGLCWGHNAAGQLGDGTDVSSTTPVQVADDHAFSVISVGFAFACALDLDDHAWCWGWNGTGQLGDGTTGTIRAVPTAVAGW